MSLGTAQPGSRDPGRPAARPQGRVIEYQQYIDDHLGRTRRRVKWVDLATHATVLGIGIVLYAVFSAIVDHWVVPGGLGFAGRLILFLGLVGGAAAYVGFKLLPLLLRKVNPVFAAAAIEQGSVGPQGGSMKNTLVNFLLLRKQPTAVPDGLLDALKEQAAVRLSTVPTDAPVDRTMLLRWSWAFAGVMVLAIGYGLGSPKNALQSVRRVLFPWSPLAAPTRVHFEAIEPGDVDRPRDDVVAVSVRTTGLRTSDAVVLYVSATGNPADDVAVPMQSDDGRYLWKTTLPPGSDGLKQDLYYYVQAGDVASRRYRIRVLQTPVINVREVRYEYPAYTGLPARIVERQGDLKALEGTRVILTAEANQTIREAHVAFDQVRKKDVELKVDGLTATGGFDLTLNKDRTTPQHTSYLLRFTNIDGGENPKPVEYKIEVTPDQPPELRVTEPTSPPTKELMLPVGGLLRVTLAARDPDFQLADLAVVCEKAGVRLREDKLLPEPRTGDFSNTLLLNAERFNLKVGDKFTFHGRATDDKFPKPNVVETSRYTVVVVPASGGQPPPNAPPENRQPPGGNEGRPEQKPEAGNGNPQAGDNRTNEKPQSGSEKQLQGNPPNGEPRPNGNASKNPAENRPAGENRPGENKPNDPRNGASGERRPEDPNGAANGTGEKSPNTNDGTAGNDQPRSEPIDPNVDPGKAFDELKKHFEEQERKQEQNKENEPQSGGRDPQKAPQSPENQKPEDQGQPKKGQPNEGGAKQPSDAKNPGQGDTGEQKQPGGGKPGEKPDGGRDGRQPAPEATERKDNGSQNPGGGGQSGSEKPPQENRSGQEKTADGNSSGAGQQQPGGGEQSGNENGGKSNSGASGESQGNSPRGTGNKTDGEQGTGRGQEQPGGKPGNEQPQPGGDSGTKTNDASQHAAEQRPGQNDGGREVARKPSDDGANVKPEDATRPGQDPTGKPTGNPQPSGAGEQKSPQTNGNPNASGNGGQAGAEASNPSATKADPKSGRPSEKSDDPSAAQPSANEGQPSGGNKNPGGNDGSAPREGGTPGQQETQKPRDKTGNGTTNNQQESTGDNSKSPGHGKSESDTQGDAAGDRQGKGEEGGGMKSPQKGTGAAGQNTASDQGGGTAGESGDQAASKQGGDKTRGADPQQGKPSGNAGEGTQSNNPGEREGGTQGKRGDRHGDGEARNRSPQDDANNDRRNGRPGNSGGGLPEGDQTAAPRDRTIAPPADEANLEYTKKVTDLTLDRLKQQLDQGQVDPELLKKFSSPDALREFVDRWDALRRSAREPGVAGEQARKDLNENLKGLGLRSVPTAQQGATGGGDDFRAVRGGRRSEPPAKYADQYRAYTTGVGQPQK